MEVKQKNVLRRNHVTLVQDLEPRGDVLNSLYEDGVLTENDCERIRDAPTRKDRCQLLLHMIPTRGPGAYGSFQKALHSSRYDFLAELLETDFAAQSVGRHTSSHAKQHRADKSACTPSTSRYCDNCYAFVNKICFAKDVADSALNNALTQVACPILDNVEPRDVLDQLFQDGILDTDDVDEVRSHVTRRKRCEALLQVLVKSTEARALDSLVKSLSKKYEYIASTIVATAENLSTITECQYTTSATAVHTCDDAECDETTSAKLVHSCGDPECDETTSAKNVHTRGDPAYDEATYAKVVNSCSENINDEIERSDTFNEHKLKDMDTKVKTQEATLSNASDNTHKEANSEDVVDGGHVLNISMETVTNHLEPEVLNVREHMTKGGKYSEVTNGRSAGCSRDILKYEGKPAVMCTDIAIIPSEPSHQRHRLTVAFNHLSTLINQGKFDEYDQLSGRLRHMSHRNYDMLCIIGYLNASRDLFRTDFDSAKRNINATMQIVPKTSNPRYFILELFTAKTRMYITQKKLEKLQTTLDEAMMILETDPGGCTGRAAGWLYINDARNKTAQMSCLNLSKPNALKVYESLFVQAKTSFQRSMNNFKVDGGKDGPFGFGYALCRLVLLLLRCGDNGMTMGTMTPTEDDVNSSGQYLQHLEDSDVTIPKILDVHYLLAKCDYQFRRNNFVRSMQHAQTAYDLALELNMLEFTEHAHNRVKFLRSVAPLGDTCHSMSEEEVQEILFGKSTDSVDTSQSD